jgi:hypothetical protein
MATTTLRVETINHKSVWRHIVGYPVRKIFHKRGKYCKTGSIKRTVVEYWIGCSSRSSLSSLIG